MVFHIQFDLSKSKNTRHCEKIMHIFLIILLLIFNYQKIIKSELNHSVYLCIYLFLSEKDLKKISVLVFLEPVTQ